MDRSTLKGGQADEVPPATDPPPSTEPQPSGGDRFRALLAARVERAELRRLRYGDDFTTSNPADLGADVAIPARADSPPREQVIAVLAKLYAEASTDAGLASFRYTTSWVLRQAEERFPGAGTADVPLQLLHGLYLASRPSVPLLRLWRYRRLVLPTAPKASTGGSTS
jgi:hypothetical protein